MEIRADMPTKQGDDAHEYLGCAADCELKPLASVRDFQTEGPGKQAKYFSHE